MPIKNCQINWITIFSYFSYTHTSPRSWHNNILCFALFLFVLFLFSLLINVRPTHFIFFLMLCHQEAKNIFLQHIVFQTWIQFFIPLYLLPLFLSSSLSSFLSSICFCFFLCLLHSYSSTNHPHFFLIILPNFNSHCIWGMLA